MSNSSHTVTGDKDWSYSKLRNEQALASALELDSVYEQSFALPTYSRVGPDDSGEAHLSQFWPIHSLIL